ncbi:hypothetical protein I546_7218 [Mycobacterium kansasii 732]|nr:hypothetical protein I546_7218 [Mycobacterium kansasii 732]
MRALTLEAAMKSINGLDQRVGLLKKSLAAGALTTITIAH